MRPGAGPRGEWRTLRVRADSARPEAAPLRATVATQRVFGAEASPERREDANVAGATRHPPSPLPRDALAGDAAVPSSSNPPDAKGKAPLVPALAEEEDVEIGSLGLLGLPGLPGLPRLPGLSGLTRLAGNTRLAGLTGLARLARLTGLLVDRRRNLKK